VYYDLAYYNLAAFGESALVTSATYFSSETYLQRYFLMNGCHSSTNPAILRNSVGNTRRLGG
jgi:hypothetical protein